MSFWKKLKHGLKKAVKSVGKGLNKAVHNVEKGVKTTVKGVEEVGLAAKDLGTGHGMKALHHLGSAATDVEKAAKNQISAVGDVALHATPVGMANDALRENVGFMRKAENTVGKVGKGMVEETADTVKGAISDTAMTVAEASQGHWSAAGSHLKKAAVEDVETAALVGGAVFTGGAADAGILAAEEGASLAAREVGETAVKKGVEAGAKKGLEEGAEVGAKRGAAEGAKVGGKGVLSRGMNALTAESTASSGIQTAGDIRHGDWNAAMQDGLMTVAGGADGVGTVAKDAKLAKNASRVGDTAMVGGTGLQAGNDIKDKNWEGLATDGALGVGGGAGLGADFAKEERVVGRAQNVSTYADTAGMLSQVGMAAMPQGGEREEAPTGEQSGNDDPGAMFRDPVPLTGPQYLDTQSLGTTVYGDPIIAQPQEYDVKESTEPPKFPGIPMKTGLTPAELAEMYPNPYSTVYGTGSFSNLYPTSVY